eukprot:683813-Rhodomonas_salina.3
MPRPESPGTLSTSVMPLLQGLICCPAAQAGRGSFKIFCTGTGSFDQASSSQAQACHSHSGWHPGRSP